METFVVSSLSLCLHGDLAQVYAVEALVMLPQEEFLKTTTFVKGNKNNGSNYEEE